MKKTKVEDEKLTYTHELSLPKDLTKDGAYFPS